MMQQKKKNDSKAYVFAFLVAGLVWVVISLIFKLYRWQHYLLTAGASVLIGYIVFIMAQGLDTSKQAPVQQPRLQQKRRSAMSSLTMVF